MKCTQISKPNDTNEPEEKKNLTKYAHIENKTKCTMKKGIYNCGNRFDRRPKLFEMNGREM